MFSKINNMSKKQHSFLQLVLILVFGQVYVTVGSPLSWQFFTCLILWVVNSISSYCEGRIRNA